MVEFGKETIMLSKLSINVKNPKDKRHINVSTVEYDIELLGIKSNAYIINQGTKNLIKLTQEKESKVNKLKSEMRKMKKNFKYFDDFGINKDELKSKYNKCYEFEKRVDKLIDKLTKSFPNVYHNLIYLDNINF